MSRPHQPAIPTYLQGETIGILLDQRDVDSAHTIDLGSIPNGLAIGYLSLQDLPWPELPAREQAAKWQACIERLSGMFEKLSPYGVQRLALERIITAEMPPLLEQAGDEWPDQKDVYDRVFGWYNGATNSFHFNGYWPMDGDKTQNYAPFLEQVQSCGPEETAEIYQSLKEQLALRPQLPRLQDDIMDIPKADAMLQAIANPHTQAQAVMASIVENMGRKYTHPRPTALVREIKKDFENIRGQLPSDVTETAIAANMNLVVALPDNAITEVIDYRPKDPDLLRARGLGGINTAYLTSDKTSPLMQWSEKAGMASNRRFHAFLLMLEEVLHVLDGQVANEENLLFSAPRFTSGAAWTRAVDHELQHPADPRAQAYFANLLKSHPASQKGNTFFAIHEDPEEHPDSSKYAEALPDMYRLLYLLADEFRKDGKVTIRVNLIEHGADGEDNMQKAENVLRKYMPEMAMMAFGPSPGKSAVIDHQNNRIVERDANQPFSTQDFMRFSSAKSFPEMCRDYRDKTYPSRDMSPEERARQATPAAEASARLTREGILESLIRRWGERGTHRS